MNQEEINVLAAEFNCTDIDAVESFAKALSLCQKFKKKIDAIRKRNSDLEEIAYWVSNQDHESLGLECSKDELCICCMARKVIAAKKDDK